MSELEVPVEIKADDYISYVDSVTYNICKSFGAINDFDDLRSCGYLGLLEAIKRFDAEKNVKFKQFAYIRISGAIVDGMRSLYTGSRKAASFKHRMEALQTKLGTSDSDVIANGLGMTLSDFHKNRSEMNKMCRANFTDLLPLGYDNEAIVTILGESAMVEPEGELQLNVEAVWKFVKANYSERDLQIMEMLYKKEMTIVQAAHISGLSECRVSQIRLEILTDLRMNLFKIQESV